MNCARVTGVQFPAKEIPFFTFISSFRICSIYVPICQNPTRNCHFSKTASATMSVEADFAVAKEEAIAGFLFEGDSSEGSSDRTNERKKRKKRDFTLVKPSDHDCRNSISDSSRAKQPCDPWRILPDRSCPCLTSQSPGR